MTTTADKYLQMSHIAVPGNMTGAVGSAQALPSAGAYPQPVPEYTSGMPLYLAYMSTNQTTHPLLANLTRYGRQINHCLLETSFAFRTNFPFSDLCLLLCVGCGYQQQGAYAQAAAPYSPPIQNSSYAPNQNYGVAAGQYDPAYQQGMSSYPGSQQQQTAPQPHYGQQSSYQSQAYPGIVFSVPARRQSQFASVLHFCCVRERCPVRCEIVPQSRLHTQTIGFQFEYRKL